MRSSPAAQTGLVVVAFAVATAVAVREDWPSVDLVFVGVLLSFLLLLTHGVLGSVARSRGARRHARRVAAVGPGEASRRAVEDERARLSVEIDRSVRRSLVAVRDLVVVAEAADDPRSALEAMQRESRSAMAELRRQLGLLGGSDEVDHGSGANGAGRPVEGPGLGPGDGQDASGGAIGRRDAVLAAAVVALTSLEMLLLPGQSGSWPMSAVMALTVLVRRVAPVAAALACASILLLGAVVDAPVGDGVFYPVVVGLLLWSLLEPRQTSVTIGSAVTLYACAVTTRFAHDPDNAPITIVVLSVVSVAAVVVGRTRRSRTRAEERARAHQAALAEAGAVAARTTRREVARELHDVVSHAVSLVAVQAGAAELAWPQDPDATRAGLHAIDETVTTALAELDARPWGVGPAPVWSDVERTVERLRRAGLDVRVATQGHPPAPLMPVVHRLVQEALTNVLKHAEGATAYVIVSSEGARTRVEVTDDGPGRVRGADGYGLVGLGDRVAAVGGTLRVGPGERSGFSVSAVLPHDRAWVRVP
ncbi:hypothetical protein GA707_11790 [Nostocoides sp. F2B08]|uniref:sensor histidine kinase n=1 Tax=Nostocoides sp. F2B08 TaxID=2653936 RepID=UPI0012637BAA|nr:histidine kinase [Tetrasphaera sp. F2B08]KAB7744125.1 hypothetical protein GA707_11790 [Tetrasphaera sp. F2B08]